MEDTVKLFYEDTNIREFDAAVLSCEPVKDGYQAVLDRTAFFPEGGGQYGDTGWIDGIKVTDTREKEGKIFHYIKEPLDVGRKARGKLDWNIRFERMQQHSAEHIISGIIHSRFGYENVGFHLGKELVTMDFNGVLTNEQLQSIELKANEAVAANLAIQVDYPSKEELDSMEYRSKKELTGQVRIVTIPGYDVCACCAPHVKHTGEIGIIRLIEAAKYKGGTRVTMVCGFRALADYRTKENNVLEISRLLSAKPYETADAVHRLHKELQQNKEKLFRIQSHFLDEKLAAFTSQQEKPKVILLFEEELDKNAARRFVDAGKEQCSYICGIFLGNDRQGYQYILGSQKVNLRDFVKDFHENFPGKGGGKSEMVQGTATGTREDLTAYFNR